MQQVWIQKVYAAVSVRYFWGSRYTSPLPLLWIHMLRIMWTMENAQLVCCHLPSQCLLFLWDLQGGSSWNLYDKHLKLTMNFSSCATMGPTSWSSWFFSLHSISSLWVSFNHGRNCDDSSLNAFHSARRLLNMASSRLILDWTAAHFSERSSSWFSKCTEVIFFRRVWPRLSTCCKVGLRSLRRFVMACGREQYRKLVIEGLKTYNIRILQGKTIW